MIAIAYHNLKKKEMLFFKGRKSNKMLDRVTCSCLCSLCKQGIKTIALWTYSIGGCSFCRDGISKHARMHAHTPLNESFN